ncbi:MAG: PDZ domain-containing protein [Planctomycetota bacterium]|nr:PDZ domain-containing protein [Planctomycetota bacterium]
MKYMMKNKMWWMRFIFVGLCLLLLTCVGMSQVAIAKEPQTGLPIDMAIEQVKPALVRIYIVVPFSSQGREEKRQGAGSGAIISPDGYVVTNYHVVSGKTKWIRCTLNNKEEVDAELVGANALADIAVIKLKPETMRNPPKVFPYARWGDSTKVKVGDQVLAMGSPAAVSQSVTYGIVSNAEMVIPELFGGAEAFKLDGEPVGYLVRWLAHDAVIYGGNSGGPLVNLAGEIIGINEIALGSLGGAIPSSIARPVAEALIAEGVVKRSWTGIDIQSLLRSGTQERGVLVSGVIKDSPADKAGIKPGDIILHYDGQAVTVRYGEEIPIFNRLVFETPIGKTVTLEVLREGKTQTFSLNTVALGKASEKDEIIVNWGITARDITALAAKELKQPNTEGVLVTSVRPAGPCGEAKPTLEGGDIIVKIGDAIIKNLAELKQVIAKLTEGKPEPVPTLVVFDRKTKRFLTVVKVGPTEEKPTIPSVRKAWFPAATQVFTRPLAEILSFPDKTGVYLTQLYPPLAKGDTFKVGDILVAIDDVPIEASEPEHREVFRTMIQRYKVGTNVTFTVLRDKQKIKIPFRMVEEPKPTKELEKYRDENFEFTAREIDVIGREDEKITEEVQGVLIGLVDSGSWAALGRLKEGDILLQVNDRDVPNIAALKEVMKELAEKKPKQVIFFVKRGIHTLYLEFHPDWTKK